MAFYCLPSEPFALIKYSNFRLSSSSQLLLLVLCSSPILWTILTKYNSWKSEIKDLAMEICHASWILPNNMGLESPLTIRPLINLRNLLFVIYLCVTNTWSSSSCKKTRGWGRRPTKCYRYIWKLLICSNIWNNIDILIPNTIFILGLNTSLRESSEHFKLCRCFLVSGVLALYPILSVYFFPCYL